MCVLSTLEADVEMNASASMFHEIINSRPHHLSNISTDKVQSCELHEGEWGKVGAILNWNFMHDGKVAVSKSVIEEVDEEKNLVIWKVIDGDLLRNYKSFKMKIQCIPKEKGSVIHVTFEYEKKHKQIEDSHSLLQLFVDVGKDIDAHLTGA